MITIAEIARINGKKRVDRYIPITLSKVNKGSAAYLARKIRAGIDGGVTRFQIRVAPNAPCYPNYITPIAGVIDYYKRLGIAFLSSTSIDLHQYLSQVGLLQPFENPKKNYPHQFADRIWRFTPETHYEIVSGVMQEIRTGLQVEKGILQSIELCLNEITDNVLNHSLDNPSQGDPHGFLMALQHNNSGRIAISVFDTGIGIQRSLSRAFPLTSNPEEAIGLSMQKGITSGNGRGNGLWILERIVSANGGSLEITSSGARFSLIAGRSDMGKGTFSKVAMGIPGTTLVDFQLDTHTPTSIAAAIDYAPVDLWLESHEDDENRSDAVIKVAQESEGFGTRVAARQIKTMAINLSTEFRGKVTLDFEDVELISASYADELVAKLLNTSGLSHRLRLRNLNDTCRMVIKEVLDQP